MLLWNNQASGNCYKVRLLLAHLGLAYERRELDVIDRSNRPALLRDKNPSLRVPVLELDDGRVLAESNAIISFLADGTSYLPDDRFRRAQVLQWMFFEQYDIEPNIAVARYRLVIVEDADTDDATRALVASRQESGRAALSGMEHHLATRRFLVADRYTVADIALYGYVHVSDEAGIDLAPFPAVNAWLDRVASQPGHVPIDA
jgi:glutathione S-transferase